jgi:hypothetical protein
MPVHPKKIQLVCRLLFEMKMPVHPKKISRKGERDKILPWIMSFTETIWQRSQMLPTVGGRDGKEAHVMVLTGKIVLSSSCCYMVQMKQR